MSGVSTELHALAWTVVLAIVQLFLPAGFRNRETGAAYNAGPRDGGAPPPGKVTARLQRAQANLYESLPLFAALVLTAHVAGREGAATAYAAWAFLALRAVYVPLYAFGVPYVRSLVWALSLACLVVYLGAVLR